MPSKILAVTADPQDTRCVYVAEAAGTVKHVNVDVCKRAVECVIIGLELTFCEDE